MKYAASLLVLPFLVALACALELPSMKIVAPVLVGHSMAGGELTTLGNQHSDRLAGLVYTQSSPTGLHLVQCLQVGEEPQERRARSAYR